jgi:YVTN family beta-propeller protein
LGSQNGTIPVGSDPDAIAYDPASGKLFVANYQSNTISTISDSTNTVIATTPSGSGPNGAAFDPTTGDVFMPNRYANNVTVLSSSSSQVVANVPVGNTPQGATYDPSNGDVYVANVHANTVSVISGTGLNVLSNVSVGSLPTEVAYDSANGNVYVSDYGGSSVTVISSANNSVVGTLSVGSGPEELLFDPSVGNLYVVNSGSSTVSVLNATTGTLVATVSVGSSPYAITLDPASGMLYVTGGGNVYEISDKNNSVAGVVSVGTAWLGIAYDSGNGNVYVLDSNANKVSYFAASSPSSCAPIIQSFNASPASLTIGNLTTFTVKVSPGCSSSDRVIASIPTQTKPQFAAYDPLDNDLYVSNYISGSITVISMVSLTAIANITVGSGPVQDFYDPVTHLIYVLNWIGGTVSVINGTTQSVSATISGFASPDCITYDLANGYLYIPDEYSNRVSILDPSTNLIVASVPAGASQPEFCATYDSLSGDIYVVNSGSNNLTVISGTTNKVLTNIPVGPYPSYTALDPRNGYLYVPAQQSDFVTVVNGSSNSVVKNITVGQTPGSVVYAPPTGNLYAINGRGGGSSNLSVISGKTNSVTATIAVPSQPYNALFDPGNGRLYVTSSASNTVTVVDTWGNRAIGNISVGSSPSGDGLTLDSTNGDLALPNTASNNVTVISPGDSTWISYAYSGLPAGCTSSNSSSIVCTPTVTGTFNVTVMVTNGYGLSSSATALLTVLAVPAPTLAGVTIQPASSIIQEGTALTLSAVPTCTGGPCPLSIVYSWSTNNSLGTISTTTGVTVTFTAGAETGIVTLKVSASLGLTTQTAEGLVSIVSPLAVALNESASSGSTPLTVSFGAFASGGVAPYTYTWSFGDGTTEGGSSVQHNFTQAGTYLINVTTTDSQGSKAMAHTTILAYSQPTGNGTGYLELSISARPATGPAPLYSHLVGSVQGGKSPYTFSWDFGDGTNSSGTGPAASSVHHNYTAVGTYVATLTVTDATGDDASTGVFITVYGNGGKVPAGPVVFVTLVSMIGEAPFTATMIPAVQGGMPPYSLNWNFGDNSYQQDAQPSLVTHTYTKAGTYYPSVQVKDAQGRAANWTSTTTGISHPIEVKKATGGSALIGPQLLEWLVPVVVVFAFMGAVLYRSRKRRTPPSIKGGTETGESPGGIPGSKDGIEPQGPQPPLAPELPEDDPFHYAVEGIRWVEGFGWVSS